MISFLKAAVSTAAYVEKPDQIIDRISTLCMLALRTRKYYEKAKPAVLDNWFYFDRNVAGKCLTRAAYQVGNDDLCYLKPTFTFLGRGWKAYNNPQLVTIAKAAIYGLRIMSAEYHAARMNAGETCDKNIEILDRWVAEKPQGALVVDESQNRRQTVIERARVFADSKRGVKGHAEDVPLIELLLQELTLDMPKPVVVEPPANLSREERARIERINALWPAPMPVKVEPPEELRLEERVRIEKINALWPAVQLDAFVAHLLENDSDHNAGLLNSILEDRKALYLK